MLMKLSITAIVLVTAVSSSSEVGDRKSNNLNERIVGGSIASQGDYPWFAYLSDIGCGAVLIHEDILLSAGHCAGNVGRDAFIGNTLSNGNDATDTIQVTQEILHPQYRDEPSGASTYDLMVLQLASPSRAPVLKLNTNDAVPADNQSVRVIGLGSLRDGGLISPLRLREVDVNVMSDSQCRQAEGSVIVQDANICAWAPFKDSCGGDSGGPLFTTNGSPSLVGIVSWGSGCAGGARAPGVYARVSTQTDFIRRGICELSANPPSDCVDLPPAPAPVSRPPTAAGDDDFNDDSVVFPGGGGILSFLIDLLLFWLPF